ncbi:MAG TPA: TetR/AcrR family transcriptional regulator [Bdellovibrionota bacterium]|jgi:AcrR family transcriptional regulator
MRAQPLIRSKRITNRDKILSESVGIFNRMGAGSTSTNHICAALAISPGNLYFHFKNKEEIVAAIFQQMCEETYGLWKSALAEETFLPPMAFIERSMEIFWRYRFFHREMYHLRRQDPVLSKLWHKHLEKTRRFMRAAFHKWVRKGHVTTVGDAFTFRMINDIVLVTASSFFQFYESPERPATTKPLQLANQYLARFLEPYFTPDYARQVTIQ